jgi:hypothetical protein
MVCGAGAAEMSRHCNMVWTSLATLTFSCTQNLSCAVPKCLLNWLLLLRSCLGFLTDGFLALICIPVNYCHLSAVKKFGCLTWCNTLCYSWAFNTIPVEWLVYGFFLHTLWDVDEFRCNVFLAGHSLLRVYEHVCDWNGFSNHSWIVFCFWFLGKLKSVGKGVIEKPISYMLLLIVPEQVWDWHSCSCCFFVHFCFLVLCSLFCFSFFGILCGWLKC